MCVDMGVAIACPAGPRVEGFRPHFTITYVKTDIASPIVRGMVWEYTVRHVSRYGGRRTLPARPLKKWGSRSFYIEGALEAFKRGLHDHLTQVFGAGTLGDYRRAHVDVRGQWEQPVYERFRLLDRISV
jgi:hypothetical protein